MTNYLLKLVVNIMINMKSGGKVKVFTGSLIWELFIKMFKICLSIRWSVSDQVMLMTLYFNWH